MYNTLNKRLHSNQGSSCLGYRLAYSLIALALTAAPAYAQVQQGTTVQPRAASTANQAPRVEGVQGQQLVEAEAIVRAARGECRLQAQATSSDMSAVGKAARSGAYQSCMASKRAGTYQGTPQPNRQ